jgi:hypothetical protein
MGIPVVELKILVDTFTASQYHINMHPAYECCYFNMHHAYECCYFVVMGIPVVELKL